MDQELFQHERTGKDFSYSLPVLPGKYQVRFKFAETAVKNKGERVFDVLINGQKALAGFDIVQEADGPDKALEKTIADVTPDAQGQITLRFVASRGDAKVCAIEIMRQ